MTNIKLSIAKLDELARLTTDAPTIGRSSTKPKAIERLGKLLCEKMGDEEGTKFLASLSQLDPQDEEAFEAVRLDICEDTGQPAPEPMPSVAATASGNDGDAQNGSPSGKGTGRAKRSPTSGAGGSGKTSAFAGKQLFPTVKSDEAGTPINPRRSGSWGYRSLAIIIGQPGITYEEFLAAGGRRVDLAWDVKHGSVRVATVEDVLQILEPKP